MWFGLPKSIHKPPIDRSDTFSFSIRVQHAETLTWLSGRLRLDFVYTERSKKGRSSYVLCHQPKSFDWRRRAASPHPMKTISDAHFSDVLSLLNQILRLEQP